MGTVFFIGLLLLFIAAPIVSWRLRLAQLRRGRQGGGFSREAFIAAFDKTGVTPEIPIAVYNYYSSLKGWKSFPFSPDDKYSEVLYDDIGDIDYDATELIQRLGLVLPVERICREYGNKPIETLRDMVIWLDWIRRHQPAAREQQ